MVYIYLTLEVMHLQTDDSIHLFVLQRSTTLNGL